MFDSFIQAVREWYATEAFIPLHIPRFGALDREYVMDAIDSTFVSSVGEYVNRFERELAEYVGTERAVATVNGTAALQVSLQLAGVGSDDEVLTQPLTFIATANSISYNRAHPVFLDVDRDTLGLSHVAVQAFLEEHAERRPDGVFNQSTGRRIAAMLPMHTFGNPCLIKELCALAEEWNIPVVEDAAEALGSLYDGQHCGTFGDLGVFSFNGNKIITCGGGGAIVTNNGMLADRAKHVTTTAKVSHSWNFVHDEIGYNYRMPNLNASLACSQLQKIDQLLIDKQELAGWYERFFQSAEWGEYISGSGRCARNNWLNAVLLRNREDRDLFLEATNKAGVMTRPAWDLMNDLVMYAGCQCGPLDNARWLADRLVNIPSSARIL